MEPHTAFMIGVAALFVTIAINRFLGERNYKCLSPEDKMKVIDQFSSHRSLATYIPIAIMACVIAASYLNSALFRWLFPTGVVLVLIVSLILQLFIFRQLRSLGLPEDYVSKFRFQSIAVQIGNVVALSMFAYGIVSIT